MRMKSMPWPASITAPQMLAARHTGLRCFTLVPNRLDVQVKTREGEMGTLNRDRGFIEFERNAEPYRPPMERLKDWGELNTKHEPMELKRQSARCMDCGTPFCQTNTGCPVNNLIPEWNHLTFADEWKKAIENLHSTNNFPEFTGRVCPAPCEGACVAGLVDESVTIKNIEYTIVDRAWQEGWIQPRVPSHRTGYQVAVVGSGPAGLAAADQLNQKGHSVTVYEKDDVVGGLLVYGIPNMKLEKDTVKRRVDLLTSEGVKFVTSAEVGVNVDIKQLHADNDAIILSMGSRDPNDLPLPGRELKGIHFAMEFLTKNQQRLFVSEKGMKSKWDGTYIDAKDKDVIVIGGGDTGTDCIGTSLRHQCKSMVNFELFPQPPPTRASNNPWPAWPRIFRTDYGHQESEAVFGVDPREYSVLSKEFIGDGEGNLTGIKTVHVEHTGTGQFREVPGSEKVWPCDLVLLALGFKHPEQNIINQLSLATDRRHNIKASPDDYRTSVPKVWAAGDARRGQSLVVWAIREGRQCADDVHQHFLAQSEEAAQAAAA